MLGAISAIEPFWKSGGRDRCRRDHGLPDAAAVETGAPVATSLSFGSSRSFASLGWTSARAATVLARIFSQASGPGRSTVTIRSARERNASSIAPVKLLVAMKSRSG
jgi:hypothetical protein